MSSLFYRAVKRTMDVAGASAALAISAPILAGAAIAVRTTLGTPVFFRQTRPGLNEKPFRLIKLRTMREPKPGEARYRSDGDRLTPLGRFLRATSIDELPTLINVLAGDMSLVGPRPLLMEYLPRYTREQARRHEVKPGVTGLAQVRGRNSISWEEKFELDVYYVDHASIALDVRILAETIWQVLARQGVSHGAHPTMPEFLGTRIEA